MAKITEMLGEKVISGFKGTLDYYYWKGLACVRTWPRSPGHKRSPPVQSGWQPFTEAVALWNTTPQYLRDAYISMASGTALSGRDMFMRAYMSGWKLIETPVDDRV